MEFERSSSEEESVAEMSAVVSDGLIIRCEPKKVNQIRSPCFDSQKSENIKKRRTLAGAP